jgi:DNA polymerase III subunit epsilon
MTLSLNFAGDTQSRLFFFDTETTGLPRRWDVPLTPATLDNWPRMVQFAWILCDDAGNEIAAANRIVRPQGYAIPDAASRIHGITNERALAEGLPLADVVAEALPHLDQATHLVAHNVSFDHAILGAECLRLGHPLPFGKKPLRCTMKESTAYCKLPGRYGDYKFPSLAELHKKLFGKPHPEAHDARADVLACQAAYFELRLRGILS